jgi:dienelactone hydrolase
VDSFRIAVAAACVTCALAATSDRAVAAIDAPPRVAVEHRQLTLEGGFITVDLDVPQSPRGRKPAVIGFMHGAEQLLDAGMVVVQYDVHWWGAASVARTTYGSWMLASDDPATVGKAYFELIDMQASSVVPRILDALAAEPDVDPKRIAVVGTSTTGFVAMQALASDRRLRAAVSIVATGDYPCFITYSALGHAGNRVPLEPAYEAFLLARDPARQPRRLVPRPLLMVNGRGDIAMPFFCVRNTATALTRAYAAAGRRDRFRLVALDGDHNVPVDETARYTVAWLRRWLHPRRPTTFAASVAAVATP